jgi:hypothetical protein
MEMNMEKYAASFPYIKDPECPASHAYLAAKAIEDFAADLIDLLVFHVNNHEHVMTSDLGEKRGIQRAILMIEEELERMS